MSDDIDRARESMEQAVEERERRDDTGARNIAILVSVLAAALALAEMQEKGAQNEYMTAHIQVSDDFAFYQAKTTRAQMFTQHAETLAALPNAADAAIVHQVADAKAEAARLLDDEKTHGAKQLRAQADEHRTERDRQKHRYELFEIVVGALQLGIVLASVSVVTRVRALAAAAGVLGAAAIAGGVLIFAGLL